MATAFDREIGFVTLVVVVLVVISLAAYADVAVEQDAGNLSFRVTYNRLTESSQQSAHVNDDETYTFTFTGDVPNLTVVRVEIRYAESEELLGAGGLCDDVSAEVGVPAEYENDTSTTSGSQTDCNEDPDIVLTVHFDSEFAWDGEVRKATSEQALREALDIERATGDWMVNVTVDVNDVTQGATDSGEDIAVTFIREYYEIESVERVGGLV